MWLFQLVYDCYPMGSLRCAVNDFGVAVTELVGSHHCHLGPVSEINIVLKQADAKWVRNRSTSVHHRFSDKSDKNIYSGIIKASIFVSEARNHVTYSPMKAVIRCGLNVVKATVNPVDPPSLNV